MSYTSNSVKKVNCFLVGGPKCGTTAMVSYLKSHPDIFISEPKESNYFMDDLPEMKYVNTLKDYEKLFNNFNTGHKIYCGASILNLHSKKALNKIYEYNKEAKIIVMLRDPMEMIPSYHQQIIYTLDEEETDLNKAWDLEESRRLGENIPEKCRNVRLLYYHEIAKYNNQLKRVYKFFPYENVKIILFDDFKKSNIETYKDLLDFLDVPYDGRQDFPKINEAKEAKSKIINHFVNRPPKILRLIANMLLKVLNQPRFGFLEMIDKMNQRKTTKKDLSDELKFKIKKEYEEDVRNLEKLISRDLSKWLN